MGISNLYNMCGFSFIRFWCLFPVVSGFFRGLLSGKHDVSVVQGDTTLQIVYIHGREQLCQVDGCELICNDDEVLADVCLMFDVKRRDEGCALDGCELLCGGGHVAYLCKPRMRQLGLAVGQQYVATARDDRVQDMILWEKGEICYIVDDDVNRILVVDAVSEWMNGTGLVFFERNENADETRNCDEYLHFKKRQGCWSYVGKIPGLVNIGGQTVGISDDCSRGNIIHEIGHAIGLHHEHIRPDRDSYIRVYEENIQTNALSNFEKEQAHLLGPYDYKSIMHYGLFAYSKNGKGTILPVDGDGNIDLSVIPGQRATLSEGDVNSVRLLYAAELSKLEN